MKEEQETRSHAQYFEEWVQTLNERDRAFVAHVANKHISTDGFGWWIIASYLAAIALGVLIGWGVL